MADKIISLLQRCAKSTPAFESTMPITVNGIRKIIIIIWVFTAEEPTKAMLSKERARDLQRVSPWELTFRRLGHASSQHVTSARRTLPSRMEQSLGDSKL